MSIAGGYFKSVEAARDAGCDCVQLFTKNNNQWRAKPISDEEAHRFRESLTTTSISHPISHASYLINLASPDRELRKKSLESMIVELERADRLGIPFVIVHPGSHTTSSEEQGLRHIISSMNEIHRRRTRIQAKTLLENTAGQGTNLGWKFEHLAAILDGVKDPDRMGVCIDTCHAFAAGYGLESKTDYEKSIDSMTNAFGLDNIRAIHLNDSKREFASRVDRHEHIGRGEMGIEPFRHLLNDSRFAGTPMYLETPKGKEKGRDLDMINLETLRGLIV